MIQMTSLVECGLKTVLDSEVNVGKRVSTIIINKTSSLLSLSKLPLPLSTT